MNIGKTITILIFIAFLSGCGGDGSKSEKANSGDDIPSGDLASEAFPLYSSSDFGFHRVGHMFSTEGNSLWEITGYFGGDGHTGSGIRSITIHETTSNAPEPTLGEKSNLFMTVSGRSETFYVERVPLELFGTGRVDFGFHTPKSIFNLPDNSVWYITGAVGDESHTGSGQRNVSIYKSNNDVTDPNIGERSGYIMAVSGRNPAFFIKPLYHDFVVSGIADLQFHRPENIFSLADGSTWLITGSYGGDGHTGAGDRLVNIYYSNNSTPDPNAGARAGYMMTVSGIESIFFIDPM